MGYSDDLNTRVFQKADQAQPAWTLCLIIKSALVNSGTGGTTKREYFGLSEVSMQNLVMARVMSGPSPAAVNSGNPGGQLIVNVGAKTNNADKDILDGSDNSLFAVNVPPSGYATAGGFGPAVPFSTTYNNVDFGTSGQDTHFYLVTNNDTDTSGIAVVIELYFNDPAYTYPTFKNADLAEDADV